MLISLASCKTINKSSTNRVPIIMVTHNREEAFEKCILALYKTTNQQIHIIDNSCGKIDKSLELAKSLSKNIIIHKNDENIGKAASIQNHRHLITKSQWFISIDPDVIVKSHDIELLISSANDLLQKSYPVGLLAPVLNSGNNPLWQQLRTGRLDTHKIGSMFHLYDGLYINEYLAGCLLLINTAFFEEIGGFKQQRIYGGDDGELSKAVIQHNLISVLNINVECEHYRLDESPEYIKWKIDTIKEQHHQQDRSGF